MSTGDINISANFNLAVSKPLDAKVVSATLADMYQVDFAYVGLICYCEEDGEVYILEQQPAATPENWRAIGSSNAVAPHTHNIADINGLDTALASYLLLSGGTVTGDLAVGGNLTVMGGVTRIDTVELIIGDNIIEVNADQTDVPSPGLLSGMRVNRGTLVAYTFVFRELDDVFCVGLEGDLQPVATREDSPVAHALATWNPAEFRYDSLNGSPGQLLRWSVAGRPEFFTPNYLTSLPAHGHTIAQISNLQFALDSKAASSHNHPAAQIVGGTANGQVLTWQNGVAVWQLPGGTPVLPAPSNLVAATDSSSIQLSWNLVSGATFYILHRSAVQGFTPNSGTLISNTITGNSFIDTPVAGMYYYRIAAANGSGTSVFSEEVMGIMV